MGVQRLTVHQDNLHVAVDVEVFLILNVRVHYIPAVCQHGVVAVAIGGEPREAVASLDGGCHRPVLGTPCVILIVVAVEQHAVGCMQIDIAAAGAAVQVAAAVVIAVAAHSPGLGIVEPDAGNRITIVEGLLRVEEVDFVTAGIIVQVALVFDEIIIIFTLNRIVGAAVLDLRVAAGGTAALDVEAGDGVILVGTRLVEQEDVGRTGAATLVQVRSWCLSNPDPNTVA